jgi:signal transduction histidine kinase
VRHNRPGGSVRVATGAGGETATLEVVNDGGLIEPEQVATLFEPFRRLEERLDGGFGLGLSIVQSVAAAHGGHVVAESRPDGGLSVSVTLAAAREAARSLTEPS